MGHLRMLNNRLLKSMDSEAIWSKSFASLANIHPTRYVRLSPKVMGQLPDLDDLTALGDGGKLEQIAAEYLRNPVTQKQLDGVFLTLVATSFYFDPTQRTYNAGTGRCNIEGQLDSKANAVVNTLT